MKRDEYNYIYGNDEEERKEAIDKLRGTIDVYDCDICGGKLTMVYDAPCFVCTKCGVITHEDIVYSYAAGYPMEDDGEGQFLYDETSYDEVYTEDGDTVNCDMCQGEIKWKDGRYECPRCKQVMSREVFFNHIGANPPGDECIACASLYPGCVFCPHGYVDDEDK